MNVRRAPRPRVVLQGVFIALFVLVMLYSFFVSDFRAGTVRELQDQVSAYGFWAPIAAIVLQVIGVVLMVPMIVLILATALAFGLDSIWISMVGQTMGAMVAYALGRALGRDVLHVILGQRVVAVERLIEREAFHYLLYLRLMSFIPLPLLAYGPGLVRAPVRKVFFAAIVGQAPAIVVVGLFGRSLAVIRRPSDLYGPTFLLPILLFLALLGLPLALSSLFRTVRQSAKPAESEPGAASGDDDDPVGDLDANGPAGRR